MHRHRKKPGEFLQTWTPMEYEKEKVAMEIKCAKDYDHGPRGNPGGGEVLPMNTPEEWDAAVDSILESWKKQDKSRPKTQGAEAAGMVQNKKKQKKSFYNGSVK